MRQCRGCGSRTFEAQPEALLRQRMSGVGPARGQYETLARIRRGVDRQPPRPLHPGSISPTLSRAAARSAAEAGTWLGLPLALVLDHIDGDPTNNRRENLRLVCPNCDSQLPTYKSSESWPGSPLPPTAIRQRSVVLNADVGPGVPTTSNPFDGGLGRMTAELARLRGAATANVINAYAVDFPANSRAPANTDAAAGCH